MALAPVRFAVVGLGHIAQRAVLPAFAHARRNAVLAALVSGEPKKRRVLGRRFEGAIVCGYEDYDDLLASGSAIRGERPVRRGAGPFRRAHSLRSKAEPSAREGEADVRILDAIDRSARTGRRVRLPRLPRDAAPEPREARAHPPVGPTRMVK